MVKRCKFASKFIQIIWHLYLPLSFFFVYVFQSKFAALCTHSEGKSLLRAAGMHAPPRSRGKWLPRPAPSLTLTPPRPEDFSLALPRPEAKKRLPRASLLCWDYNASRPGENSSFTEECLLSTCCRPQICRKIYAVEIFCWWWSLPMCASMKYYGNTCCVEFFGESNVIHILYFPFPRWNYSNFWIQCKRNCRGPHWSHPVWILFPWINSDQLNVSTAKKNPQIRNIKTWKQYFGLRWSNTLEISNLNLTYFEIWCCKWYV